MCRTGTAKLLGVELTLVVLAFGSLANAEASRPEVDAAIAQLDGTHDVGLRAVRTLAAGGMTAVQGLNDAWAAMTF